MMGKTIFLIFMILPRLVGAQVLEGTLESDGIALSSLTGSWRNSDNKVVIFTQLDEKSGWIGWESPFSVVGPLGFSGLLEGPKAWDNLGAFSGLWTETFKPGLARVQNPETRYGLVLGNSTLAARAFRLGEVMEGALTWSGKGGVFSGLGELRVGWPGVVSLWKGGINLGGWSGDLWAGLGSPRGEDLKGLITGRIGFKDKGWEGAVAGGTLARDFYWVREGVSKRRFWVEGGVKNEGVTGDWSIVSGLDEVVYEVGRDTLIWGRGKSSVGPGPLGGSVSFEGQRSLGKQDWVDGSGGITGELVLGNLRLEAQGGIDWSDEDGFGNQFKGTISNRLEELNLGLWALAALTDSETRYSYGWSLGWILGSIQARVTWERLPRTWDQNSKLEFWGENCHLKVLFKGSWSVEGSR